MEVLVIDDEEGIRRLLCRILEQMSHHTVDAADGRTALALFQTRRVDLVVTDLYLSHQHDVEALVTLCKSNREVPIPVIAITGGDHRDRRHALAVAIARHADVTLRKPFRRAAFVACVNEVMQGAKPPPREFK